MSLAALVLAAGRGERLRPLTDEVPKPLLRIGDVTLLDAALARVGAVVPVTPSSVVVNAHWLAEQIVTYVDGRTHVSVEQPEALGTAGAVGAVRGWLDGRDLLIANGDVWWDGSPDLTGFVNGWDHTRPRLLVVADDERPDFEGRWRFAGLSLLPAAVAAALEPLPSGLYELVWSRMPIDLVPADVTFIDCGTPEDLETARQLVHAGRRPPTLAAVTLPDHERALLDRPVQPYIGLPLAEAEALAADEGRHVRVLESLTGPRRLDLMPSRVNVALNDSGRVVAADAG